MTDRYKPFAAPLAALGLMGSAILCGGLAFWGMPLTSFPLTGFEDRAAAAAPAGGPDLAATTLAATTSTPMEFQEAALSQAPADPFIGQPDSAPDMPPLVALPPPPNTQDMAINVSLPAMAPAAPASVAPAAPSIRKVAVTRHPAVKPAVPALIPIAPSASEIGTAHEAGGSRA